MKTFACRFPIVLSFLIAYTVALAQPSEILLHGDWRFQIDSNDVGINERWFDKELSDTISLPGSMLTNLKGNEITLNTKWTGSIYDSSFFFNPATAKYRQPGYIKIPFWLSPLKHYVGAAWYQHTVKIPASWKDKRVSLYLERAHTETQVWVNDKLVGIQNSLAAPHEYFISDFLKPGINQITIRVDNRIKHINVGPDSHSISDHTQGNWNGIIGKIALQLTEPIAITDVQIFPDISAKIAKVRVVTVNETGLALDGIFTFEGKSSWKSQTHIISPLTSKQSFSPNGIDTFYVDLPLGDKMLTWSEYQPALYSLSVKLKTNGKVASAVTRQFGMREVKISGRTLLINDIPVSLRGTLNNCEFPLTGYPATDIASWERIFKIVKDYGLNHVRFHSWCPPEAAFAAADKLGIYLQPEAPSWPNHGVAIGKGLPIDQYLYDETERILKEYGNHPSFIMMSGGNEPAGNQVPFLNSYVSYWKERDNRRVYTGMSVGGSWPVIEGAQFQVRGGVRGLTWDKEMPETISDYSSGINKFPQPFIAHEMGQWCVFPDFNEIKEYTGAYRARNFEMFQENLRDMGMEDQAEQFLLASGKLQVLCYKNEIEKLLRTPGYAGFQLLGLQDFPGQGTALVGVVNAFWKPKPYVSAEEFRRFCNDVVPLLKINRFVFRNSEDLRADILVSSARPSKIENPVFKWQLAYSNGKIFAEGKISAREIGFGNGQLVGAINISLQKIAQPCQLNLSVGIEGTKYINDWNIWVYPDESTEIPDDIYYTTSFDEKAKEVLEKGGKVFFNAAGQVKKGADIVMYFQTVFWNTSWFQMKPPHVTGINIQSKAAAFDDFPTAFHSDLQWWDIVNKSQVMVLEDFPEGFRPLVQPIDTWFLNRRLGLVFEAAVGSGKLIVSSADLRPDLNPDKIGSRQLFKSLIRYMQSSSFAPPQQVAFELVADLLKTPSRLKYEKFTSDSPDELKPTNQK